MSAVLLIFLLFMQGLLEIEMTDNELQNVKKNAVITLACLTQQVFWTKFYKVFSDYGLELGDPNKYSLTHAEGKIFIASN